MLFYESQQDNLLAPLQALEHVHRASQAGELGAEKAVGTIGTCRESQRYAHSATWSYIFVSHLYQADG